MTPLTSKALALAALFPRGCLHAAAVKEADARASASRPWAVALSGGADSVALLLLVWAHWPGQRGRLVGLHFNHRLRGTESDADETYCRQLCAELGVVYRGGHWDEATPSASEGEAREARHAFFSRELAVLDSSVLWTGHQKDDIAETQLMRLARGSGSAGLAAPRPVGRGPNGRIILRPLLTLNAARIREELRRAQISWREDASNLRRDFYRNRIRLDVTPAWQAAAGNDALEGAALSRGLLEEDDSALEHWLAELLPTSAFEKTELDLRCLRGKPRALVRRALRRWRPASGLARAGFEALLDLAIRGEGDVSVGQGQVAVRGMILRFVPSSQAADLVEEGWTPQPLDPSSPVRLPDGSEVAMREIEFSAELRERVLNGGADCSSEAFLGVFHGLFTVRLWAPGDRYRPLGAPGSAKLQDLFVNRKVPMYRRSRLPVICAHDGRIVWVPGFPPAENSKVTLGSVTGVQLTYRVGTSTVTR